MDANQQKKQLIWCFIICDAFYTESEETYNETVMYHGVCTLQSVKPRQQHISKHDAIHSVQQRYLFTGKYIMKLQFSYM